MALLLQVWKLNKLFVNIFCTSTTHIFIKNIHNSDSKKDESDVLDIFTTQLLQKKNDKWENKRMKQKLNECNPTSVLDSNLDIDYSVFNIRNYNDDKINNLLHTHLESLDAKNILFIAQQCIHNKICPSPVNLQKLLSFFAQTGDKNSIQNFQDFIKEIKPDIYKANAEFLHYLAEAAWVKGNIHESLKLFDDVYRDYAYLRRKLKLMIKYMITNVLSNRSEATLIIVINFVENITLKYDDYFLLVCVWQACFLSEWYADQCRAAEILDRHEKLCDHIGNRVHFVVNSALKSHQTEVVHRLFELLLKYKMKSHYSFVLQSLFNYRYWQNDLRSCAEIIQWSLNVEVSLPTIQQQQFLILLLNHDTKHSKKLIKKPLAPEHFQLKF